MASNEVEVEWVEAAMSCRKAHGGRRLYFTRRRADRVCAIQKQKRLWRACDG
jgi:hypothetical protein